MEKTKERVAEWRGKGCNCAQTVLACLLEDRGMEMTELLAASKGLGGGLGCGDVCGCVLGGAMAMGRLVPDEPGANRTAKILSAGLVERFSAEFGTLMCRELRNPPEGKTPAPCNDLMAATVPMCEAVLAAHGL